MLCFKLHLSQIRYHFSRPVNYYYVLGVSHQATHSEIKSKYYKLAKLHHPDSATNSNQHQFISIKQAYSVIGNAEARAMYDRKLRGEENKERDYAQYQTETYEKYPNGATGKSYSKRHQYVVRVGLAGILCSAVYLMLGLRDTPSDYQVRKNNLIMSRQNVNSSTGVIEKRRKLYEEQRKQKKFSIVPITIHFDLDGNAYTNEQNIKPHKKRGSTKKGKKSTDLQDMAGIRKQRVRNREEREFQDEYI